MSFLCSLTRHWAAQVRQRRSACRPRLEVLEDRYLLSAGSLDLTFGTGGVVTTSVGPNDYVTPSALAIYPTTGSANDGKIVAVGTVDVTKGNKTVHTLDLGIVRYNPNGTLDTSFASGGELITGALEYTADVVLQSDGKIVVGGRTTNYHFGLVRYNANGTLDKSFGGTGLVTTSFGPNDIGETLALQPDGKLVLAGEVYSATYTGDYDIALARYNPDGSLDNTFNGNGKVITSHTLLPSGKYISNVQVTDVAIDASGKIDLGARKYADTEYYLTLRYNANGSLDTSFNGTGIVKISSSASNVGPGLAIQSDGSVLEAWPYDLVHLTATGTLDLTFGVNGFATTNVMATAVALQGDGKVLVAGAAFQGGGLAAQRFLPTGTVDTSYGSNSVASTQGVSGRVVDGALQPDGKFVVLGQASGQTATYAYYSRMVLARFEGDSTSSTVTATAYPAPQTATTVSLQQMQQPSAEPVARWQARGADTSARATADIRGTATVMAQALHQGARPGISRKLDALTPGLVNDALFVLLAAEDQAP
jgi:uncharacterized delta-60 repeat protein